MATLDSTFAMSFHSVISWIIIILIYTANVTIANPPQISPVKVPDNLEEGQRLVIACVILKGSQPISFSWRKENIPLIPSSDVKVVHSDSYQDQLQIEKLNSDHVGNYTCSARNSFGSDQMSVSVALKFMPRWTTDAEVSKHVTAIEGGQIRLDCSVKGYPIPTVKILKGMSVFFWK